MDYDKFKKDYEAFENWHHDDEWEALDKETNKASDAWKFPKMNMYNQASLKDGKHWLRIVEGYDKVGPVDNDGNFYHPEAQNDLVNSPAHYTRGSQECIDTIEEAIQDAPNPITGSLQYQVLKYILRMWLKGNALRDAEKARWYLNRLISKLEDKK
jgi:hypothetical protein